MSEEEFLINECNLYKIKDHKKVLDENKITKSIEEYLKNTKYEFLYEKSTKRIYKSEYYLNKHNNYLVSLKSLKK